MPTFPLITHERADSVIAWRDGRSVSAARFLSDVARLSATLPGGGYMLNACNDRYRFTVGLAAALVSKKVSLLPSTHTPEMIRQLLLFAPDVFCLTDSDDCSIALPQSRFPVLSEPLDSNAQPFAVPRIDGEQLVAYVFTSGSTGVPVPHPKTWGALVRNVRTEAQLCGLNDGRHHAIIGTVPPQHMYGFESTVLLVLQSANALVAGQSFYPADICNTVRSAPRPRVLISTPVHMRSVISAGLDIPAADLVMSATAPLSLALAEELESRFQAPLLEIYGSTETGQIAVRSPTQTQEWQLFPGVRLEQKEGVTWASGGHVERAVPMNDVIEPVGENRFLLHGRTADLINIAGKRNSLMNLNLQLNAIPGVLDGSFFMPDEVAPDGVTRLTAFVVAPGLTAAALMAALRERVDSVFLPRPLIFVEALPRNNAGKLPREALELLAAAKAPKAVHSQQRPTGVQSRPTGVQSSEAPLGGRGSRMKDGEALLSIAPDHPAFRGHFPGRPIVPGVVLLDHALDAIGNLAGSDLSACQISAVKFLSPVLPGEPVRVRFETLTNGAIRFDIVSGERKVATGSVRELALG